MNSPAPNRSSLGIVYFTVFLDLLGFGIILPFLPYFALKLGATGMQLGIILTAYSLAQLLGAAVLGRFSDRLGRRPILLLSLAGSAISMVISGLAEGLLLLVLARALAGLFGGSISTAQAYIADVTQPEERAKFMGLLGAAIGLGFVLGPALGVLLNSFELGFAGAAFTAAGLAAVNFLFALFRLDESRPEGLEPPPKRSPAEWWRALTAHGIWQVLVATFLTTFAFVAMETTFALFGEVRYGMNEKSFGLALVFVGVVMVIVQGGLIGPLTRRFGVRGVAATGGLLMGASLLAVPFSPTLVLAVLALGGLAAGQGLSVPTHSTIISRLTVATEQGSILGARQSCAAAARAAGPVLAGALYDMQVASPYWVGGALAAMAGLLLTRIKT